MKLLRELIAYALVWLASKIETKDDELSLRAEITKTDVNGRGIEGKVIADNGAVIMARRVGFCEWEGLFALDHKGDKLELPSCFSLNADATMLLEIEGKHEGRG